MAFLTYHLANDWTKSFNFYISPAQSQYNKIKKPLHKALSQRYYATLYSWNRQGTKRDENISLG